MPTLCLEPLPDRLTPSAMQDDDVFKFKLLAIEQRQAATMAVVPAPLVVVGEACVTCQVPATVPVPCPLDPLPVHK